MISLLFRGDKISLLFRREGISLVLRGGKELNILREERISLLLLLLVREERIAVPLRSCTVPSSQKREVITPSHVFETGVVQPHHYT
jgi:hypothetical protein